MTKYQDQQPLSNQQLLTKNFELILFFVKLKHNWNYSRVLNDDGSREEL